MQTISDNIRNLRKASNMSQDELAEKLGVSRQSVSLWETGQTQPTIDNIVALAKIFGTTSDAILATDAETESKTDLPAVETSPEESGKSKKIPVRRIVIAASAALIIAGIALCIILIKNSEKQSTDGGDIPEDNSISEAEPSEKKTEPTQHVTGSVSTSSPAPTAGENENTESTNADFDTPEPTFYDNGNAGTVSVPPTEQAPSAEQGPSAETHVSTFDLFSYCKSYAIAIGNLNSDVCLSGSAFYFVKNTHRLSLLQKITVLLSFCDCRIFIRICLRRRRELIRRKRYECCFRYRSRFFSV